MPLYPLTELWMSRSIPTTKLSGTTYTLSTNVPRHRNTREHLMQFVPNNAKRAAIRVDWIKIRRNKQRKISRTHSIYLYLSGQFHFTMIFAGPPQQLSLSLSPTSCCTLHTHTFPPELPNWAICRHRSDFSNTGCKVNKCRYFSIRHIGLYRTKKFYTIFIFG